MIFLYKIFIYYKKIDYWVRFRRPCWVRSNWEQNATEAIDQMLLLEIENFFKQDRKKRFGDVFYEGLPRFSKSLQAASHILSGIEIILKYKFYYMYSCNT